jgi:hypothetical protein
MLLFCIGVWTSNDVWNLAECKDDNHHPLLMTYHSMACNWKCVVVPLSSTCGILISVQTCKINGEEDNESWSTAFFI